jgi:hypothetical protein
MYKMLIEVLVRMIRVKTLGFALWPESVMATSCTFQRHHWGDSPSFFRYPLRETPDPWIG